ncbi:MAG: hypothetical protein OEX04_11765 [Acidimicrobiia bacterium]|nr:hypothetical protein [Acidimicrobiia bacterium]MDH4308145.1 hypothetical protein [Acidimicrobiia bacterium]MDH5293332.1 hypothetical protein [Acidimicrobiia bacterium]
MKRRPNPWIAIPALAAGIIAGALAWAITGLSCQPGLNLGVGDGCPVMAASVGVGVFVATTVGMAIVLVLVFRSLAEYREARERGAQPPGPGCEVPEN